MSALSRWAGYAVFVFAATPSTAPAQFRTPEDQNFHNSTFVGNEPEEARATFFAADDALRNGDERDAGRQLTELLRSSVRGPCPVGERLIVPLPGAVRQRLGQLSPEIRRELAELERAAVDALIDQPDERSRAIVLAELLERHPLSGRSQWATKALGLLAFEEGRFGHAAGLWSSGAATPLVGGDWEGPDSDLLQLLDLARERRRELAPARGHTLGGDATRAVLPVHSSDSPSVGWVKALATQPFSAPEDADHRDRFPFRARTDAHLPTRCPVSDGEVVVTLEDDGIHVRELETGADRFESLRYDFDLHVDPLRFGIDLDASGLTLVGTRLYVNLQLVEREFGRDTPSGALFVVDLEREGLVVSGRLEWERHLRARELAPPDAPRVEPWSYAGPPVWVDDRLYLPAMRMLEKETECWLRAFDAATLEVLGECFLARASPVARYADRFSQDSAADLVRASALAERDGVLYVCTNLGVFSAVRAADLELLWSFRYNRILPVDSRSYVRETFFVTGGWPCRAPEVLGDRLLTAPSDSRYLYSLALWPNERGDLRLADPVEKETRLAWIGADRERLYFLTRAVVAVEQTQVRVQATDHSGGILWESPALSVREPMAGVPALTARYLYLPTDRSIYRLDLEQGGSFESNLAPPDAVGLPYPRFGAIGDLTATADSLYSHSSRFLIRYRVGE